MLPVNCLEGGDAEELDMELVSAFPKLADAGGYELLRVVEDKGRSLELSPQQAVVLQAKIYIRPIQRNLSTEQVVSTGLLE